MAEPSQARARLVRLAAEIAQDRPTLAALGDAIAVAAPQLGSAAPPTLAFCAMQIHRWYTALETMLQRIERAFGAEPDGGDWHVELLRGAALDLPGVRPPVLPAKLVSPLREVLRFRHFFRHAYAVELDGAKLVNVAHHIAVVSPDVDASLADFEAIVRQLASALAD